MVKLWYSHYQQKQQNNNVDNDDDDDDDSISVYVPSVSWFHDGLAFQNLKRIWAC